MVCGVFVFKQKTAYEIWDGLVGSEMCIRDRRETLHRHFGEQMKYSGRVGLTHRASSPDEPALPGAKPAWFFAPDQIRKRAREWGPGGIDTRFGAAWSGFAPRLEQWLAVTEGTGPESVKQAYLDTLNGRVAPEQGHILSL